MRLEGDSVIDVAAGSTSKLRSSAGSIASCRDGVRQLVAGDLPDAAWQRGRVDDTRRAPSGNRRHPVGQGGAQ